MFAFVEKIIRGRNIYDKCLSIDEMIDVLTEEIDNLKKLKRFKLDMDPSDEDRVSFKKAINSDSAEYRELTNQHDFNDITDMEIPY